MNNLKFGIFDIFTYLLPGGVIALFFLVGVDKNYVEPLTIKPFIEILVFDTNTAILAIIGAYLVGIVCQYFGSLMFHAIRIYILKQEKPTFLGLSGAEFHVLLREFSPRNFAYVELYLALRGMSHNLAFAFGIGGITLFIKYLNCDNGSWIIASLLSFLFAFVFFSRAKMFHAWYYEDGIAAVKTLKLQEKNQDSNHS
jgi:hypothetical protein